MFSQGKDLALRLHGPSRRKCHSAGIAPSGAADTAVDCVAPSISRSPIQRDTAIASSATPSTPAGNQLTVKAARPLSLLRFEP